MTHEEAVDDLLEECRVDHVGLWELISAAYHDLGLTSPGAIRAATMRLARSLLVDRGVRAGFPSRDGRGFLPWNLQPDEALRRIDEEWDALGREPTIGDIVWFTTPDGADSASYTCDNPTPQPPAL